jgi:DNA-binding helix-hairpin-helix protein with protein kinase domain
MKTPRLFTADGRPLTLDRRVGKGGEGEVYALASSPDTLVKFYTLADLASREAKVKRMIVAGLAGTSPLVSFPLAVVRDKAGKFAGFTMKAVVEHQPLHELYSPGARKASFPRADYRFLVRSAGNVSRAIASVHAADCVIGDINHSGILISDKATAALIDADSFQVSDGAVRHFCKVGVPEYTPPELQGQKLDGLTRTPNHDAFGLAVVVFQLLWMGRHPYSGRYLSKGEMPIEKAIAEYRFAYSKKRQVGMEAPPAVPPLSDFPPQIGAAFEAAFSPDGSRSRPSPKQWISLLGELERDLRPCPANNLHHYPQSAPECPWCRMERMQPGVQLFVPAATFDPAAFLGTINGDLATIWRAIEAVKPPPAGPSTPTLPTYSPFPSAEAKAAKASGWKRKLFGAVLVMVAVGIFAVAPSAWIFWLGAGGFGLIQFFAATSHERFIKTASDVELRWLQALDDWQKRGGDTEFAKAKAGLAALKAEIEALPSIEQKRVQGYATNRRAEHLKVHLDRYQIRRHKITGVGPSKLAMLTSYGIETAADISSGRVQAVPGFGPVNSRALVEWRRKLETKFVYNANPTAADRVALNTIKADVDRKAAELKARLGKGPAELAKIGNTSRQSRLAVDPVLQRLHEQRTQAKADLALLGLAMPSIQFTPKPAPRSAPVHQPGYGTTPRATGAARPAGTPTLAPSGVVSCPKCSSRMILRTAQRGRNAGNRFYGCSRYPSCRGTRSAP